MGGVADEAFSVPAPALGYHLHVAMREGRVVASRFATAPQPARPLGGDARAVADLVARHLALGREDLSAVPVDLSGLPEFQRRALGRIRAIPPGRTSTYGEVALALGAGPAAARAVGGAMAANPIPLIVPCHRVVPAGARPFANYSGLGGTATKRALLRLEGASPQQGLLEFGSVADLERERGDVLRDEPLP